MNIKPHHQVLTLIPCLTLAMAPLVTAAKPWQDAKPAPGKITTPAANSLTKESLVGAWVGKIAGKGKIDYDVVLAFHSDGKGGLVFFEPNGTDFPLVGTWKLNNGVVILTPDPKNHPDGKPMTLALTRVNKNEFTLDLGSLGGLPPKTGGKKDLVTLRSATDEHLKQWFSGKRPD